MEDCLERSAGHLADNDDNDNLRKVLADIRLAYCRHTTFGDDHGMVFLSTLVASLLMCDVAKRCDQAKILRVRENCFAQFRS